MVIDYANKMFKRVKNIPTVFAKLLIKCVEVLKSEFWMFVHIPDIFCG